VAGESYVLAQERNQPAGEVITPVTKGALIFSFVEDGTVMEMPHLCSKATFQQFHRIGGWYVGDHSKTFNHKLAELERQRLKKKKLAVVPEEVAEEMEPALRRSSSDDKDVDEMTATQLRDLGWKWKNPTKLSRLAWICPEAIEKGIIDLRENEHYFFTRAAATLHHRKQEAA
jgi:hypothetical protein